MAIAWNIPEWNTIRSHCNSATTPNNHVCKSITRLRQSMTIRNKQNTHWAILLDIFVVFINVYIKCFPLGFTIFFTSFVLETVSLFKHYF
jgi:hypothetical protein